ncbi:MAG: hypothetical protein IK151_05345 [Erysipelotrichaceae bacterium]|nr:hypothetical protein [Erysipelotrichaceae bacterium]
MSLIAAKSDYIMKADIVYQNLQEYEEIFESEALVINHLKCLLLREEDIDDFNVEGINVNVYNSSDGYQLFFENYVMEVSVYEKQIVSFSVKKQ